MQKRIAKNFCCFLDNFNWIGCVKLFLLRREYLSSAVNALTNSPKVLHLFIYLSNLFNVDYKTLASYALIKMDYHLPPPIIKNNKIKIKHNKNVNKSVKKENKLRIQFFEIIPTTCWMYVSHILQWTLFTLPPSMFQFPL